MKRFLAGLWQGLLAFILLCGTALGLLLGCNLLYRVDIRLLNIPENTGWSEQMILDNYRAVTDYLSPFQEQALALPTLTVSAQGTVFFRQLRVCVLGIYALALVAAILLICMQPVRARQGRRLWNISGAITLALTVFVAVPVALDFTGLQTRLCNLLFPGETWLMFEDLDPVVLLFPPTYFVHGAMFLLFITALGSMAQFALGCAKRKPTAAQRPEQPLVQPESFGGEAQPRGRRRGRRRKESAEGKKIFRRDSVQ